MVTAAASADGNKSLTARLFNGRRFPKRLLILVPLILATSMPSTSLKAQSDNATVKSSGSFPFTFFNPCTEEIVSGVVDVTTTVHVSSDAHGGFHFHVHEVFRGRAVGETSGIQYVGPQTDHETVNDSSSGAMVDTLTLNFRFVSRGGADDILIHALQHITVTPDGTVTSEFLNVTNTCKG
jgi:hypothetical protein